MIRQDQGFGSGESAIVPTGAVRQEDMKSQQPARTMGETGRNVGKSANHKAGGPFSPSHAFGSVIGKGALRGTMSAQAGGPVGASGNPFFVAFNEVVFCSGPVPGGAGC
jgi:hypothetical protein